MLVVLMVLKEGKQIEETVQALYHCANWVHKWVARFEEDGLCDLPRSGRPRAISIELHNVKGNVNPVYTKNKQYFTLQK